MVIKLLQKLMIDGLYPSQLPQLQAMKSSHYRNLKNIVNKNKHNISFPSAEFLEMSRRKKTNHHNWKTYNNIQSQQFRFKKNLSLYSKLQKITSRPRYSIKTQVKESKDSMLHHNYLYQTNKRFESIQKNNSLIASRIISVKSEFNHKKQQIQYQNNKFNVSRLEKFERLKRLTRIVNRSISQKFIKSPKTKLNINICCVQTPNPQTPRQSIC